MSAFSKSQSLDSARAHALGLTLMDFIGEDVLEDAFRLLEVEIKVVPISKDEDETLSTEALDDALRASRLSVSVAETVSQAGEPSIRKKNNLLRGTDELLR